MTVQFILGRAGSGKTHHCLEAVREGLHRSQRGPALVLLVPEQATYQVERALVTTPGLGGYQRAHVLSFQRLAYQVLLDVGGTALPPLDAAGKQMVLRSILKRRRADLRLFEQSARQRGFIERLAATLKELHAYGLGADRLRAQLGRLEERGESQTLLALKLHDLAVVLEEYEKFLTGAFLDPDSYLDLLARRLPTKNRFHGARFWVDGFASFTGQEERVLEELMRVAGEVHIAFCLDPDRAAAQQRDEEQDDLSMFSLLEDTYERVRNLARASGQIVLPPRRLPKRDQPTRFSNAPALAHLERSLFAPDSVVPPDSAPGEVTLTEAADQRCEVRAAAEEILRLCRDEGFRFRDIAVIVRDFGPYRSLIDTVFRDYEIPHFIDVRRDVAHHPLVELIRAALDVVVRGWRSQDLFRYAKTDLTGLDRSAVDRLENYVLAHGIEGRAWHGEEPWQFRRRYSLGEDSEATGDDAVLDEINGWRDALIAPLRRFEAAMAAGQAIAPDLCWALHNLLEGLQVAESLETWALEAERDGRLDEADEHRQVWGAVVDLLDQAVVALGGEPVSREEWREIVESGLAGIRLRLVPPALDEVLVGSIERSRHPAMRAAFVLGMNDRTFPQLQTQDVVFADRERDGLDADGIRLGPVSEKRLLHERFLAYIALTRPSERLYVSYAQADPMGKALHPSPFLDDVRRCFPDLGVERVERNESFERIGHWRSALAGLAAALRPGRRADAREQAHWIALYDAMRSDGRFGEPLARRVGGLAYENRARPLGARLAERLYGANRESSVSRLETFAACPFKHFARYGLALEERKPFRLDRIDLGLLYHEVLKEVFEQLSEGRPLDWAAVEPQHAVEAVDQAVGRLAPRLRSEILHSSARNRYVLEATRAALAERVRVLIAASRRDGFCQAAAELDFGRGGEGFGPLEIELPGGKRLLLRGCIDRVDVGGDPPVLRVIDYKSRARRYHVNELVHGLALQLPTYLLAIDRSGRGEFGADTALAGALYVPILRGVETVGLDAIGGEEGPSPDLSRWKARGFFDFRWAALFDAEVAAGSGRSPVVALAVKKDGAPHSWGRQDALPPDGALEDLLRWTERRLAEFGRRVAEGDIQVSPYQLGQAIPCRWCEYRPVCRFDAQRQPYNVLPSRKREGALNWIREQVADRG